MDRCIVIGAGELTVPGIEVKDGDFVIAADAGFSHCERLGIEPDLIVGDFDSLKEGDGEALEEIRRREPERILTLPSEKDDTDMLAAIRVGLEKGCREFFLYGGLGGRLGHTIANIQCLNYLKERGASGYLTDASGLIQVAKNETIRFEKRETGWLSLFSLGEKAEGVTLRGLKYELTDAVVTNSFPIGVSNEFIGKEAAVTVRNGTLLILTAPKE
ncbi:MAG TPA: thiamine diphosphokinase [Candidatus Eisenbergiella pullicola]|nr:thiamine diphosphokinase [Candidatus Eisenbergiella pullicola]